MKFQQAYPMNLLPVFIIANTNIVIQWIHQIRYIYFPYLLAGLQYLMILHEYTVYSLHFL